MKTRTIYAERYHKRKAGLEKHKAAQIVAEADAIFCDAQGEIELPGLDGQRRMFVTMTLERIVRDVPAGGGEGKRGK